MLDDIDAEADLDHQPEAAHDLLENQDLADAFGRKLKQRKLA